MLPGLRFLFAALVLSISTLVFGFGAAALFRTAHEEFVSTPSWQPAPETRFAQSHEAAPPVLAMLRVDDPPKDASKDLTTTKDIASSKDVASLKDSASSKDAASERPNAAQPIPNGDPANSADPVVTATEPVPAPDTVAAVQPSNSTPPVETAKPEAKTSNLTSDLPAAEKTPPIEAPAATPEAPAAAGTTNSVTAEPTAAKPNGTVSSAPIETVPAPEQPSAPAADAVSTKIATLGGPPVQIETVKPKAAAPKADTSDEKKTRHAKRERRHRRANARVTLQAPQAVNPFGQPATTAAR